MRTRPTLIISAAAATLLFGCAQEDGPIEAPATPATLETTSRALEQRENIYCIVHPPVEVTRPSFTGEAIEINAEGGVDPLPNADLFLNISRSTYLAPNSFMNADIEGSGTRSDGNGQWAWTAPGPSMWPGGFYEFTFSHTNYDIDPSVGYCETFLVYTMPQGGNPPPMFPTSWRDHLGLEPDMGMIEPDMDVVGPDMGEDVDCFQGTRRTYDETPLLRHRGPEDVEVEVAVTPSGAQTPLFNQGGIRTSDSGIWTHPIALPLRPGEYTVDYSFLNEDDEPFATCSYTLVYEELDGRRCTVTRLPAPGQRAPIALLGLLALGLLRRTRRSGAKRAH